MSKGLEDRYIYTLRHRQGKTERGGVGLGEDYNISSVRLIAHVLRYFLPGSHTDSSTTATVLSNWFVAVHV